MYINLCTHRLHEDSIDDTLFEDNIDIECKQLVTAAMTTIWEKKPLQFQEKTLLKLVKMRLSNHPIMPLLLLQTTGGGKSMIPMTFGYVSRGVTLVIENMISLASDQKSKFENMNEVFGAIHAFQLDSYKKGTDKKHLCNFISNLNDKCLTSIFLFSSPEKLLQQPWKSMVQNVIRNNMLKLICIDEVHQFVSFGSSFRPIFSHLKESLFKRVKTNNHSIVKYKTPILLMTATFNRKLELMFQDLSGINMDTDSLITE